MQIFSKVVFLFCNLLFFRFFFTENAWGDLDSICKTRVYNFKTIKIVNPFYWEIIVYRREMKDKREHVDTRNYIYVSAVLRKMFSAEVTDRPWLETDELYLP